MEKKIYSIAKEYSLTPGSRFIDEGDFSGQDFRDTILKFLVESCIEENQPLEIDLDGTAGYGSSFLEESFGGLVRVHKIKYKDIKKILSIKSSEEPYLVDDVMNYLKDAAAEADSH